MFQFLCWPTTINDESLVVTPRGDAIKVDAANHADAHTIAIMHLPLREGEQMAVRIFKRIINVGAWQGFSMGQGGNSEKTSPVEDGLPPADESAGSGG